MAGQLWLVVRGCAVTLSADWWGILPVLAWLGAVCMLRVRGATAIDCLARGTVVWAAAAWVAANLLSGFDALGTAGVRAWWLLFTMGLWVAVWRGEGLVRLRSWPTLAPLEWAALLLCLVPVVLAGIAAAVAPAATIDVLNYHQPRQWMWLQNGGLGHFPTLNDRMLMMPPLAEVIGVHFLALTGDDRWANLPQWAAYVLSTCLVFGSVRRLGGGRAAAWLGAWLVLTLPMAYHEASNAKNDLMGAFWTLVVLNEVIRARIGSLAEAGAGAWAGAAAGLAVLTKSTAFLFLPGLLFMGIWFWGKATGSRETIRAIMWAAIVGIALTGPFFARNIAWYGSPLGKHAAEDGGEQANTVRKPWVIASNGLRLASQHFALPSERWNQGLEGLVRKAHAWADIDVEDKRTTLWVLPYTVVYHPSEESYAGAGMHLVLILSASVLSLCLRSGRRYGWVSIATLLGALLYMWILKWQPWAPRLQIPVFMMGCVLFALLTGVRHRSAWVFACWALGLLSWWPSRESSVRPLWTQPTIFAMDRELNRYRYAPHMIEKDEFVVAALTAYDVKELSILSIHEVMYPLMRRLGREVKGLRINTFGIQEPEAVPLRDYSQTHAVWQIGRAHV